MSYFGHQLEASPCTAIHAWQRQRHTLRHSNREGFSHWQWTNGAGFQATVAGLHGTLVTRFEDEYEIIWMRLAHSSISYPLHSSTRVWKIRLQSGFMMFHASRQWALDCGGFLEGEIHIEKDHETWTMTYHDLNVNLLKNAIIWSTKTGIYACWASRPSKWCWRQLL